jgi:hypothetical protein
MAMMSMTAHVEALFPVKSEMNPAVMPPTIPPTSNRVERYAASSGLMEPEEGGKKDIKQRN